MQDEKEIMLFEQAQKGEKESKELLILKNIGLVHHVIKRYVRRGQDVEDLFQIGTIGLMKAVEKFDTSYGVCFSTYAVPMIAGEIRRFLRDDGMVKVSRGIKENIWKISQVREEINKRCGRDATLQEISSETGIDTEDVIMALDASKEVESIYQTVYQSDGAKIYLIDQLGTRECERDSDNEKIIDRLLVNELMQKLPEKERQLIYLRFYENKTQTQVATSLGMTQVQVSRLEKKILLSMRNQVMD